MAAVRRDCNAVMQRGLSRFLNPGPQVHLVQSTGTSTDLYRPRCQVNQVIPLFESGVQEVGNTQNMQGSGTRGPGRRNTGSGEAKWVEFSCSISFSQYFTSKVDEHRILSLVRKKKKSHQQKLRIHSKR